MRNLPRSISNAAPEEVGRLITEYLNSTFESLFELRTILSSHLSPRPSHPEIRANRESLAGIRTDIQQVLREHNHSIDGIGIAAVEGFLEDSPFWLEWWRFDQNNELEFVPHTLNPSNDVFYDYASQAWFTKAVASSGPSITGPYVDAGGTGEYTITLCIPVSSRETVVGVLGADIDTSHFEKLLPSHRAANASLVLVNGDHRVIASNNSDHLPGEIPSEFANAQCVFVPVYGIEQESIWRLWFW